MKTLHFSIDIAAPVNIVWSTMLDDETYRVWTGAFHEGSRFDGDWNVGSTIRFVGPNDDGTESGLIATVVENRPHEFVSLEYAGQVDRGADDLMSDFARSIAGTHENYSFSESGGTTTLTVDLETDEDYAGMFEDMWPKALDKLKDVAES
ncbi:SRPBCC domain-containing protein [Glaciihabitans sp. dw_435]|uniref:SRPBCC family protein n=1 Tax=Glaciihabitans sp. dw_435 TaxID=2720081 RepID=UPI001BD49CCA|nr:SRPBCC domain-containing protein [Glaciihabitans sp. dw_435]